MSRRNPDRILPARRRREEVDDSDRDEDDRVRPDTDEEEGEDLEDPELLAEDYVGGEALNRYDEGDLDDRQYGAMDVDQRMAAERALEERDRRERRRTGLEIAGESEEGDETESTDLRAQARRRRYADAEAEEAEEEAVEPFDLGAFPPTLATLRLPQVQAEIKRRFYRFLTEFTNSSGERHYLNMIGEMTASNSPTLEISYLHLSQAQPTFGIWVADFPKIMFELFNEIAREVVLERYPDYSSIQESIYVRLSALPIEDKLRDLRATHLNRLIKVAGVVTKRTSVNPTFKLLHWTCLKGNCRTIQPPIASNGMEEADDLKPSRCIECQSEGPFGINHERTIYSNYQTLTLQESPGSVPAGRVPRYKEVILLHDLIDGARPGEEIEVTGIYNNQFKASLNQRNGFPVFGTVIEANFIQKRSDALANNVITEEDIKAIDELRNDPHIIQRIIKSIAPSIYGHQHVKMAVAMAMFGGREKNIAGKHRVRGDINCLLLGDPGTAKSQMLKYVEKTAPRCVYTTGKGASAVGLTAAVSKDPVTGEWTLEGGALVLADRGVCCIDEFDKMTDQDRTSIHEAMEQQSISISKAGIVTTLQARCAVIAAANPIGGRYDPSKSFSENVQLTDPILTRFDCLCVLRDEVDLIQDQRLARFVVASHVRSHPQAAAERNAKIERLQVAEQLALQEGRDPAEATAEARELFDAEIAAQHAAAYDSHALESEGGLLGIDEGEGAGSTHGGAGGAGQAGAEDLIKPIDQNLLRKYILHAREKVKPSLEQIDSEKIPRLYSELRKEAEVSSGVPIAVRHIESMIRMSEAVARMRHATHVSDSDLNVAIRTQLHSFISAQKLGVQRSLRAQFQRYLHIDRNYNTLLLVKLRELVKEAQVRNAVLSAHRAAYIAARASGQAAAMAAVDDGELQIKVPDLFERARRLGITDLTEFLQSEELQREGFSFDHVSNSIIQQRVGF